jgi:hypothetical protein
MTVSDERSGGDGTMMELDFDDSVARALRGYVRMVRQALGLRGECSYVQDDGPASAYIALDGRLSRFPGRDVALLWDERHGWSLAIETHSGEELFTVARLAQDVLPSPDTVAAWVRRQFLSEPETEHGEHRPASVDADTMRDRLAAYVVPVQVTADLSAESLARR